MAAHTPAERALARSYTTGDGAIRFNVTDLTVDHQPDRSVTLTYRLIIERKGYADECWVFTLPWGDKSFVDVFTSSAPDPERLRQLVELVSGLLEEWWDTKGYNRRSAKMGRRCS
ncbi:hypothetical protein [Streptomyces sp. H27-C3]|uniref:hypothetical protein n=1 Tax=Streptomyces sp. H27-C3 TaxID=3046305 RepID=UPI0024BAB410|nr:hypothetical protein [Streptomyces sp. H27-C3]MDJ0465355.1 hypothetical protein [Streptomyces sp. H27-C3]